MQQHFIQRTLEFITHNEIMFLVGCIGFIVICFMWREPR